MVQYGNIDDVAITQPIHSGAQFTLAAATCQYRLSTLIYRATEFS